MSTKVGRFRKKLTAYSDAIINSGLIADKHKTLASYVRYSSNSPLTANNEVKLLINGEQKFPELLQALEKAKSHIHLEYYIYENDFTGNQIADMLIKKAQEGVEVRFMYDDFGSYALGKTFIRKLSRRRRAHSTFL